MLATGAVSTAVTNNIWTNKYKPRNADLGTPRAKLTLREIPKEVGKLIAKKAMDAGIKKIGFDRKALRLLRFYVFPCFSLQK